MPKLKKEYIKQVKISKLWKKFDIEWNLHPDVNILAGGNGSGKTTMLECIYYVLTSGSVQEKYDGIFRDLELFFNNNERTFSFDGKKKNTRGMRLNLKYLLKVEFEKISTFDLLLKDKTSIEKISENNVFTALDWEIYQLQKKYMDYQLNLSKEKDIIVDKSDNPKEALSELRYPQNRFLEMLDELFEETGKKVDKTKNEVTFILDNHTEIKYFQLSSGEKQMLIILLTTLVQNKKPTILFMDEPEISLHIDWQQKLIGYIRELNPNIQLIIATHSPAIIMEGWLDKVFNVSDIIVKNHQITKK